MSDRIAARLFVSGKVQGVGFRKFSEDHAKPFDLSGYVRNLSDGRVEIEVVGEKDKIEAFLQKIRQGPPRSKVTSIDITWVPIPLGMNGFSIRL